MKAQGTTEYIILVAIALIVTSVLLFSLNQIPGFASSATKQTTILQSLTNDVSIAQAQLTPVNSSVQLTNAAQQPVVITQIRLDNTSLSTVPATLLPGQQTWFYGDAVIPDQASYTREIEITYRIEAQTVSTKTINATIVA